MRIKIVLISLIIMILSLAAYFFQVISAPAEQEGRTVYFEVKSGQGVKQIALQLKDQKLIKNSKFFEIYVWLAGAQGGLLAGDYELNTKMSTREIVEIFKSGKGLSQERVITIIEGWRLNQIADYLSVNGLVKREDFIAAARVDDWREQYDFLAGVTVESLEGFLFPDTYRVFRNASASDIVKRLLDNFDRKLTLEKRAEIRRQNKTIFEIITLASIVEKEARTSADKKMVADVFWKRLAIDMPLQSDATVNYVTGKKEPRPTFADLAVDSPYSTYKYRGLPPGPIANPGLAAIDAVIYPVNNDYYYFINDQKTGQAIFGRNYQEHQANIRKYLD